MFTTIEAQTYDDAPVYKEISHSGDLLKHHVEARVGAINVCKLGEIPNVTITGRDKLDVLRHLPLTAMNGDELVRTQAGASISILAPIGPERPDRWVHIVRAGGHVWTSGLTAQFVERRVGAEILKFFNAGDEQEIGRPERYKDFATGTAEELWIRPAWRAGQLFPAEFPPRKPPPGLSPEDAARNERSRAHRRTVELARKRHASSERADAAIAKSIAEDNARRARLRQER